MLSHRNGGQDVIAKLVNISAGGAFIHSHRFLTEGSELTLVASFPPNTLGNDRLRALCRAKVIRLSKQLIDGNFGMGLRFLTVQQLPEV
jgi:hypothetical protein